MRRAAAAACAALLLVAAGGCERGSGQSTTYAVAIDTSVVPPFSGANAHALLRRQVEFGPRVAGKVGHANQLAWMVRHLRDRADTVVLQPFDHTDADGRELRMSNVFARFNTSARDRILLIAHWDTRPTADMDDERPKDPIAGANDGASGTAVLLELASVLSSHSPPIGVDILLVDGEDYGPGESHMYLGAKHFAANQPPNFSPLYGILVDMVGDRDPRYPIEGNSFEMAPEVVDRVWSVAEQIGLGSMFTRVNGGRITDDHIPLNKAGIRTIDIIDFDYEHWHTHGDVVENTSPVGLEAVGRVLTALIYNGG
ncbi:MAG TPA: M28 family peptidase [Longimicrobiales bacterium]|nr:M28 family peptidase [Longimicrobiales bacterium]